jgi:hypothetical protein
MALWAFEAGLPTSRSVPRTPFGKKNTTRISRTRRRGATGRRGAGGTHPARDVREWRRCVFADAVDPPFELM